MAARPLTIFFDLDGTLLDISGRHHAVYREASERVGGTPLGQQEYWRLKRRGSLWQEILLLSGMAPTRHDEFLRAFTEEIERPHRLALDRLFPAALEVLASLSERRPLYLLTLRRSLDSLQEQLEYLGISRLFQQVLVGAGDEPAATQKIALVRRILPTGSPGVVVGDTEADVEAGQALGLTTIAVSSGIRDEAFLRRLAPDHLVAGIADVQALLADDAVA